MGITRDWYHRDYGWVSDREQVDSPQRYIMLSDNEDPTYTDWWNFFVLVDRLKIVDASVVVIDVRAPIAFSLTSIAENFEGVMHKVGEI